MSFLGYGISVVHKPSQKKVKVILDYPKPKAVVAIRRFIGIINFYTGCIPKAAYSQFHLNKFLKGDKTVIKWDEAFRECKNKIAHCDLLHFPNDNTELCSVTHASDFSIDAALEQKADYIWEPLSFFQECLHLLNLNTQLTIKSL